MKNNNMAIILVLIGFLMGCRPTEVHPQSSSGKKYKTERVIILVIDGPRYSETWGDNTHQYIPHMAKDLAPSGIICTNFHNNGYTYTTSGHAALCTGVRQELENSKGSDLPRQPSIFQHYLKESGEPSSKAWLITSKDKLFILGNTSDPNWHDQYNPSFDCGNSGPLSGYRNDTTTFKRIMEVLQTDKPNLMLVNFKEPDGAGHANNWPEYLKGIVETDSLVWEVWKFIQTDDYYKDKTTLFITNDHGRHLNGWKDGFVSHGDGCEGCRHINLFAFGPDFKKNTFMKSYAAQVDIPATTAELLGFKMPYGTGKVMMPLFK